jgi:hypothetical protein
VGLSKLAVNFVVSSDNALGGMIAISSFYVLDGKLKQLDSKTSEKWNGKSSKEDPILLNNLLSSDSIMKVQLMIYYIIYFYNVFDIKPE